MTKKNKNLDGWEERLNKHLTDKRIDESLEKISFDICKYSCIQDRFKKVDVSQDEEFQNNFNSFYRITSHRDKEWRKYFYLQMQNLKNRPMNFLDVLSKMFKGVKPNQIESSFVSKMLATKNPKCPIIDKYVKLCFKLKSPSPKAKDRVNGCKEQIKSTDKMYKDLVSRYERLLKSELGKNICRKFDKKYPESRGISDIKKVDFVLWKQFRPSPKKK